MPQIRIEGIHGKERDIIPDKDKEKIQTHEEAEDARYQQEVKGKELFDPFPQLPHGENSGKMNYAGQEQQGQIETIRSVEIVDAQGFNPQDLLHELKSPLGSVIGDEEIDGEQKGHAGKDRADPADQGLSLSRDKKDNQKTRQATEQDRRQAGESGQVKTHGFSL